MKYHIVEDSGFFLIKISGESRKNEALPAKRMLFPYLKEKGVRVIMDLKELKNFEPIILLGVLYSIRKETNLLGGGLKLCSLKPEILNYFRENRLDQFFQIYENEEKAKKSEWRNHDKR
ncbi:MAG: STAS domain-containing protein [Pseudomonadota bacterium]|jgi:anti-anti-sigma factor